MKSKLSYRIALICLMVIGYSNAQQLQDSNSSVINAYFNMGKSQIETQAQEQEQKSSLFSETSLFQVGDSNYINIKSVAKDKVEVVQQGNENFYEFISYYGSKDSNMQVIQNGNNNGVYIYGENNLTKNLIIRQQTDNQHIFITNYK